MVPPNQPQVLCGSDARGELRVHLLLVFFEIGVREQTIERIERQALRQRRAQVRQLVAPQFLPFARRWGVKEIGKAGLIEDYWRVFLLFGAVIQIIDDWTDLEKDLAVGHYSYVTLGFDKLRGPQPVKQTIQMLRTDTARVRSTYDCSKAMISESRAILARLNDPFLVRLVDVTDLRLDTYFRKELKFA